MLMYILMIYRMTKHNLQTIPGVGKSLAQDLIDLGYHSVDELKSEDPEMIYQNLIDLRGEHIDRCVLYVFRCAVPILRVTRHTTKSCTEVVELER